MIIYSKSETININRWDIFCNFAEDYIYQKRDNVKEKQRELNKLFLDKSLRNSYAMREKRIKQAENDPITAAEDKPKLRKYFTKEQEKRDQVLKYILSI